MASLNQIPNPSFEVNLNGWTVTGATAVRAATPAPYTESWLVADAGSYSMKVTATGGSDIVISSASGINGYRLFAGPGSYYYLTAGVYAATNDTRLVNLSARWWDKNGNALAFDPEADANPTLNAWNVWDIYPYIPDGAFYGGMVLTIKAPAAGEVYYIDAMLASPAEINSGTDYAYFDGSCTPETNMVGDVEFGWTGEPHNSESYENQTTNVKDYYGINNIRLEVQIPDDGLPNLVQNTDGQRGAWFWLSPVNNTVISGWPRVYSGAGDQRVLKYTHNTTGVASYFTTEFMKATAGKYFGARFDLVSITAAYNVKVRFEWYDSSRTLISSSTQTGALGTAGTTYYVPAALAPAGTVYVKLRYDFYNGTANPGSATSVSIKNVMVTYADTAAGLGSTRTNLITNPSFETNMAGWEDYRCVASRDTTQKVVGSYSLKLTCNDAEAAKAYITLRNEQPTAYTNIAGGRDYTFSVQTRPGSTARYVELQFNWFDSTGKYLGYSRGPAQLQKTGQWNPQTYTATSPTAARKVSVIVKINRVLLNEVHYVDAAMLVYGRNAGTYFDGSTAAAGSKTYSWTGTAHASQSVETSGAAYDFSESDSWQNILGPTHEIKLDRKEMDVGLLSAVILDANLDPHIADFLRPGARVRLSASGKPYVGANWSYWEEMFNGTVTNAHVTYNKEKKAGSSLADKGATRIEITASDFMANLANQQESRGVASVDDLPYILEGKGVPWRVNGSGDQVNSATVVSTNDNASVVDQIAVTRDSNLGYAWMDRWGVINVYGKDVMNKGDAWYAFSDNPKYKNTEDIMSYASINVDFDTDSCINDVTIKWLRYTPGKGTEEITYAGYRDQNSIDTWGAHASTFTMHGASESGSNIALIASNILAANANPQLRVNNLTFPVVDAKSREAAATIDLYDGITIQYDTKVNDYYRVTAISHTITTDDWNVTLDFGVQEAVAQPTWSPSPPAIAATNFAAATHTHDDRYFTETESDARYYTKTTADTRYRQASLPETVRANLGSKAVTTTSYAAVAATNNISITSSKAMKCVVHFGAYMKVAGTSTCEMAAKVVISGATTADSASYAGTLGTIYQWSNGTTINYSTNHGSFIANLNAGTNTFTVYAYRSTAATVNADLNNLWIEVTPIAWLADYA